jgi:hypothetical protein
MEVGVGHNVAEYGVIYLGGLEKVPERLGGKADIGKKPGVFFRVKLEQFSPVLFEGDNAAAPVGLIPVKVYNRPGKFAYFYHRPFKAPVFFTVKTRIHGVSLSFAKMYINMFMMKPKKHSVKQNN